MFWHQFGTRLVRFGWPWATFLVPFHALRLAWHHPSVTLYSLNLGTNLHDLLVSASWYSSELLRISGQLLGILLGIPSSFMVFDKVSWYSTKAPG